jgi:hypothetical protein
MNAKTFNIIVNERVDLIKKTLTNKAKEYVINDDRLYNFKRAGEIARCKPKEALKGMMLKHLVSVFDLIEQEANSDRDKQLYLIDEKIGDAINYLILLEALLKEEL